MRLCLKRDWWVAGKGTKPNSRLVFQLGARGTSTVKWALLIPKCVLFKATNITSSKTFLGASVLYLPPCFTQRRRSVPRARTTFPRKHSEMSLVCFRKRIPGRWDLGLRAEGAGCQLVRVWDRQLHWLVGTSDCRWVAHRRELPVAPGEPTEHEAYIWPPTVSLWPWLVTPGFCGLLRPS